MDHKTWWAALGLALVALWMAPATLALGGDCDEGESRFAADDHEGDAHDKLLADEEGGGAEDGDDGNGEHDEMLVDDHEDHEGNLLA